MTAVSWISIIVLGIVGNIVEQSGLFPNLKENAGFVLSIKIIFFTLFLITAFSIAPLLIRLFIILAKRLIPENYVLKKMETYEFHLACGIWLVWLTGLIIVLPVMIAECFFCS